MLDGKTSGPLVLVEGLDLAGKSTLVNFLQEELCKYYNCVHYSKNSLVKENSIARFADTERKKPEVPLSETCPLFIAAHLYDAHLFKYPAIGEIHLQDSSWMRTLAFNSVRENNAYLPLLTETLDAQPVFDLVIYLTASIGVRQKRVHQRERAEKGENDHSDYLVHTDPELFKRNDDALRIVAEKYCASVEVIDTSHLSPVEVRVMALSLFQKHCLVPT
ncbi:MAG: hypothetical protein KBB54_02310 [Candidatus Pacebacteria bacterium]|nr:hypothetical protein [Candidatus Paceibacterota bacterium]